MIIIPRVIPVPPIIQVFPVQPSKSSVTGKDPPCENRRVAAVTIPSKPSVTINAGNISLLTSVPATRPTHVHSKIANNRHSAALLPSLTRRPATIVPSTAIEPLARSIPAVRMIIV
jgi:hypothetical protein